jgi:hypothetical protein
MLMLEMIPFSFSLRASTATVSPTALLMYVAANLPPFFEVF